MDAFVPEAIRQLAGQGTGWLLFVIALAACFWLFKRLQDVQDAAEKARELLHEKRLAETRETLRALNDVAVAQAKLADSIKERTETLKTIAELVTQIERDTAHAYEHWQGRVKGMEQSLARIEGKGGPA